jgi:hypothetical protein
VLVVFLITYITALFNYAKDTNQTGLVKHFSDSVSRWADEWDLSMQDKRGLLWVVSTVLQDESASLKFLIKYLNTFEIEEYSAQAAEAATAAVVSAIRSPMTSFSDRSVLYQVTSSHSIPHTDMQEITYILHYRLFPSTMSTMLSSKVSSPSSALSARAISLSMLATRRPMLP